MFTLDISDLRTEEEIKEQSNEFKKELIELLNDYRFELNNIEDEILNFIESNRIHYSSDFKYHQKQLKIDFSEETNLDDMKNIMREYSKSYPCLLFKLTYKSSNLYESIVLYIKNGKIQECPTKIVVEDFDEKKLI